MTGIFDRQLATTRYVPIFWKVAWFSTECYDFLEIKIKTNKNNIDRQIFKNSKKEERGKKTWIIVQVKEYMRYGCKQDDRYV